MDSWRGPSVPHLPGQGPETKIVDTASGELVTAAPGPPATLYACGITPYDATHIGHAATFLAWDLLVRAWRDAGYAVTYVQNVTDVDDPLLERAARDGEDWRALADREIALFNLGSRFLAIDNRCPHRGGPLADGIVAGNSVVCPLHAWKVCLENGTVERPVETADCIKTYPAKVESDIVWIAIPVHATNACA